MTTVLRRQRLVSHAWLLFVVAVLACRERGVPATADPSGNEPTPSVVPAVDSSVDRRSDESLTTFAQRQIPAGAVAAFAPLEYPSGRQDTSVAVLFRDSTSQSNYSGLVLSPQGDVPGRYRRLHLPEMDEAPGLFEITVRDLFAAGTAADSSRALVVQYEYYRTGSGESPGVTNIVYHRRSGTFGVDTAATSVVQDIRSKKEILARLGGRARPPQSPRQ